MNGWDFILHFPLKQSHHRMIFLINAPENPIFSLTQREQVQENTRKRLLRARNLSEDANAAPLQEERLVDFEADHGRILRSIPYRLRQKLELIPQGTYEWAWGAGGINVQDGEIISMQIKQGQVTPEVLNLIPDKFMTQRRFLTQLQNKGDLISIRFEREKGITQIAFQRLEHLDQAISLFPNAKIAVTTKDQERFLPRALKGFPPNLTINGAEVQQRTQFGDSHLIDGQFQAPTTDISIDNVSLQRLPQELAATLKKIGNGVFNWANGFKGLEIRDNKVVRFRLLPGTKIWKDKDIFESILSLMDKKHENQKTMLRSLAQQGQDQESFFHYDVQNAGITAINCRTSSGVEDILKSIPYSAKAYLRIPKGTLDAGGNAISLELKRYPMLEKINGVSIQGFTHFEAGSLRAKTDLQPQINLQQNRIDLMQTQMREMQADVMVHYLCITL